MATRTMTTRSKKPINVFSDDDEVSENEYLQDFAPTLVPSFRVSGKTVINKKRIVLVISSSSDDEEEEDNDSSDSDSDEVEIVVCRQPPPPPQIQKKLPYSALPSALKSFPTTAPISSAPSSPRQSAQSSLPVPIRRRLSFNGDSFLRNNNSLSDAGGGFSQDDSYLVPFKGAFEVSAVPDLMAIDDPKYFDFANQVNDDDEPEKKPTLFQEAIAAPIIAPTKVIPITDFYPIELIVSDQAKVPPPPPPTNNNNLVLLPPTEPMVIDEQQVPVIVDEVEVAPAIEPELVMKVARTSDENVQPEKPRGEPLDTDMKRKVAKKRKDTLLTDSLTDKFKPKDGAATRDRKKPNKFY